MKLSLPVAVLLGALPYLATAQVAILHIQVIEGEGAISAPGSRSARPLAVEVTDETGKPVEGAAVSFHLLEEGPGGTFGNGLRTEVTVTDSRGRASLHTLQVNRIPGRLPIRIVVSKEQAHAGMVAFQYIAEMKSGTAAASRAHSVSRGKLKWVVLAAVAAGGAVAAGTLAGRSGVAANAPAASSVTTTTSTSVGLAIGGPVLTVGKP